MSKLKKYWSAWAILLVFVFVTVYAISSVLTSSASTASKVNSESAEQMKSGSAQTDIALLTDNELEKLLIKEASDVVVAEKKPDGVTYVVQSGDTVWDISATYKISVDSIVSANDMASPDSLKIGQPLLIPGAAELKTVVHSAPAVTKTVKLASRSTASSGVWPVKGHLTSSFGQRGGEFHKGIDIAAPTGTDVYAYADGKVIFSGWDNGGYGYLVIISHGNGIKTYYGHNSKLLVSVGQSVSGGQHIAEVGNTGDSDGSHCHFE